MTCKERSGTWGYACVGEQAPWVWRGPAVRMGRAVYAVDEQQWHSALVQYVTGDKRMYHHGGRPGNSSCSGQTRCWQWMTGRAGLHGDGGGRAWSKSDRRCGSWRHDTGLMTGLGWKMAQVKTGHRSTKAKGAKGVTARWWRPPQASCC